MRNRTPGCRTAIHRGYGSRGHFYSSDLNRVSDSPYGLEANSYFYLYAEAGPSMRPLFLCHKGDDRYLLSTETACEIGVGPSKPSVLSRRRLCAEPRRFTDSTSQKRATILHHQ